MSKKSLFAEHKTHVVPLLGVHRVELVDERGRVVWDHLNDNEAWGYRLSEDGATLRIMKLEARPAGTPL